jgi:hypothetical protein
MSSSQSGTSVLAALVFVAVFVIMISSYKIVAPAPFPNQSATAASATVETMLGPVAQISCQPKAVDPGMSVGVAFGCANSTVSEGSGFSTGGRLWGATEEKIPATLPSGTMIYVLTCSSGRESVSASCAVAVHKPLVLITSDDSDGTSAVAWLTRGMQSCEIETDNPDLAEVFSGEIGESGAIAIPEVSEDTGVILRCTTYGGQVREAFSVLQATI